MDPCMMLCALVRRTPVEAPVRYAVYVYIVRTSCMHDNQVDMISLPDHTTVRTMLTNQRLRQRLLGLAHGGAEFFEIEDIPGVDEPLPAWVLYPPGFDRQKARCRQYPLLVYVYRFHRHFWPCSQLLLIGSLASVHSMYTTVWLICGNQLD